MSVNLSAFLFRMEIESVVIERHFVRSSSFSMKLIFRFFVVLVLISVLLFVLLIYFRQNSTDNYTALPDSPGRGTLNFPSTTPAPEVGGEIVTTPSTTTRRPIWNPVRF